MLKEVKSETSNHRSYQPVSFYHLKAGGKLIGQTFSSEIYKTVTQCIFQGRPAGNIQRFLGITAGGAVGYDVRFHPRAGYPIRGWVVGQEWLQGRFWAVDGRATHARCVRCRPISLALTVRRDFLPRYARLRRCTREYRSTRVPSRPGRPGFVSHVFPHILSSRSTSSDGSLSFVT